MATNKASNFWALKATARTMNAATKHLSVSRHGARMGRKHHNCQLKIYCNHSTSPRTWSKWNKCRQVRVKLPLTRHALSHAWCVFQWLTSRKRVSLSIKTLHTHALKGHQLFGFPLHYWSFIHKSSAAIIWIATHDDHAGNVAVVILLNNISVTF